ncbi:MAG: tryptophan synthase subunit alpha [Candidatus Omnitrophica bacterium]|nr:tryptophan synthase subunit alpha [Candidatus Omnitrophota bacterium]
MNRIDTRFISLKRDRKKAFIVFITAGYPDLKTTANLIKGFEKIGVDIVELGVPFSDPIADGPVIQKSSLKALKDGVTLNSILRLVKGVRREGVSMPICLMSYYNPIFCFGENNFVRMAELCGVDGLIVPDLPPEEAFSLRRRLSLRNLAFIPFLSPTSSAKRIKYISRIARGFIYYVSLTGVTGMCKNIPEEASAKIRFIKRITKKPVCVGFGISTSMQVKEVSGFSDGVIIGSAIIKEIRKNLGKNKLVDRVLDFVSSLKR